ncbi:MAG: hypothetical protein ACI87O_001915 [Planctomycetota bacterium]|jgi:hypothetical protein
MSLFRFLLVIPFLGVACQAPGPKELEARIGPEWSSTTGQFYGSALVGPSAAPSFATAASQAWTLELEVIPIQGAPPLGTHSMVARTAWAMDPSRSQPLLPAAMAAEACRWFAGPDAAQWRASLAPKVSGMTIPEPIQIALSTGQTFAWRGQPAHDAPVSLTAFVSRPKGSAHGCTITLAFAQAGGAEETEEIVEFDTPWRPEQGPFTIVWTPETPAFATGDTTLALHFKDWKPAADDIKLADAFERGEWEWPAHERHNPEIETSGFPSDASTRSHTEPAGIRSEALTRASQLGAVCSQDWLWVCGLESSRRWLEAAQAFQPATEEPQSKLAQRVHRLDSLCLSEALDLVLSGTDSDSAFAFLVRQTGQFAQFPEELQERIQLSPSPLEFLARLTDGNRAFLEHASPSVRLRAFDWLHARSLAPPGFDPLERSSQRRRALERWQAMRIPPTGTPELSQQGTPH